MVEFLPFLFTIISGEFASFHANRESFHNFYSWLSIKIERERSLVPPSLPHSLSNFAGHMHWHQSIWNEIKWIRTKCKWNLDGMKKDEIKLKNSSLRK